MRLSAVALVPVALFCWLLAACSPATDKASSPPSAETTSAGQHLSKVPVVIHHQDGRPPSRLSIEIALGPRQQEAGLMHRTDIAPGEGMLFPMLPARMPAFWMKDTPTPLDLIFIRMNGSIVRIIANTKPNDRTPLFAEEPVAGVLELRGGDAARLGIREEDRVNWGACIDGPFLKRGTVDQASFCPAAA
ncbi:MAG: DUF192 domain-containing protein [Sphingobium sp.]|nr:DUF192 domain-containing protein [Sphingobium sp.]MBP6111707.1 DUF192 domain-containing protein [Sphingobium sp.]MBP8672287.1 DUF192 domain-containing protein [Sphingobium sp.]MBP9157807.1 DUF192 domain-containing protein [Sphingobium sp.]MCC6482348.1 DUF192 domain-containing protein [Sphingomonadaceae bacterium]